MDRVKKLVVGVLMAGVLIAAALNSCVGITGPERAEGLNAIFRAAEQGDTKAQTILGDMHETGEGVPQNYAEAAKWYRLAAEQGDALAAAALGDMYASGRGVPQDHDEAERWYRLAVEDPQGSLTEWETALSTD